MPSYDQAHHTEKLPPAARRVALFDIVRGFSVVSMVLFHLCYDLRYLHGFDLSFFRPPLQDIWRASISWTFLFVAGCMCSLSRNGLTRSLRYLAVAGAVFLVTTLAAVDTPISFGIIFCMGASTLIDWGLQRLEIEPSGWLAALILFLIFLAARGIPRGYVSLGFSRMALPPSLYSLPWFAWLGLPGPGFASGDYYPIIPFTFMYLTGVAAGRVLKDDGYPLWFYKASCKPLEWVGQHALPIYIVHQPLILAVLTALL